MGLVVNLSECIGDNLKCPPIGVKTYFSLHLML